MSLLCSLPNANVVVFFDNDSKQASKAQASKHSLASKQQAELISAASTRQPKQKLFYNIISRDCSSAFVFYFYS